MTSVGAAWDRLPYSRHFCEGEERKSVKLNFSGLIFVFQPACAYAVLTRNKREVFPP